VLDESDLHLTGEIGLGGAQKVIGIFNAGGNIFIINQQADTEDVDKSLDNFLIQYGINCHGDPVLCLTG
jgi:hypothetical protein